MKLTNACPKCQSQVLWRISPARVRLPDTKHVDLPVAAGWEHGSLLGWNMNAGHYEVWVCDNCGFTEWYAQDFRDALREMAKSPKNDITLVDRTTKQGPFR